MYHITLPREAATPESRTSTIEGLIPFTEMSFVNKTGKTVYIKDRHGAHQAILPLPAESKLDGMFHVYIAYHTTLSAHLNFDNHDINQHPASTVNVARRATTKYTLDPKVCVRDEVIFSQDLGLLISLDRPLHLTDVFPDTSRAHTNQAYRPTERVVKSVDLAISVVIVDNINPGQPYYINIENRVYKIETKTSEEAGNLPDGVHVIDTRSPVDGSKDIRYDIDECIYHGDGKYNSPFTLFVNLHDAKTNGHRNALIEAENHKLELELKDKDKQLLDLKVKISEMKELNALRKEQQESASDSRRDYYEERSYRRKDTSESLSMPAKVIGGLGAVAAAIFGMMKLLA